MPRSPRRWSSGVLEAVPGRADEFLVPSPQELAVAAELHAAGVPLRAISGHLRELRGQVEHIASRFLEFTTEHVFARYLGHRPPTDADAAEAASLVRRLRPLAQQTVDAELARAMRTFATQHLQLHLTSEGPPPGGLRCAVRGPAGRDDPGRTGSGWRGARGRVHHRGDRTRASGKDLGCSGIKDRRHRGTWPKHLKRTCVVHRIVNSPVDNRSWLWIKHSERFFWVAARVIGRAR